MSCEFSVVFLMFFFAGVMALCVAVRALWEIAASLKNIERALASGSVLLSDPVERVVGVEDQGTDDKQE